MSRFVYNLRYIKSKAKKSALVKYIATREGVEKVTTSVSADNRPESGKQHEKISELIQTHPEAAKLLEYEDYQNRPTMKNASALISSIIENYSDSFFSPEEYIGYIGFRPGVEKKGTHGLFSSDENIDLETVKNEIINAPGNLYTGVLSLRREDAARLSYENAAAWRAVIMKNLPKIAEAYKVPLTDLKWYAAFHNESHHPHCHMIVYSAGKAPYISNQGIEHIKSAIATDIFREELTQIYSAQQRSIEKSYTVTKDLLNEAAQISAAGLDSIRGKLMQLSEQLESYTGKKVYGYLPKMCKALVNDILEDLAKEPAITEAYKQYTEARQKQLLIYHSASSLPPIENITDNAKFKKLKNEIIKQAFALPHSLKISDNAAVSADEKSEIFAAAPPPVPLSAETSDNFSRGTARDELDVYRDHVDEKSSFAEDSENNTKPDEKTTDINSAYATSCVLSLFKSAISAVSSLGNYHTKSTVLQKSDLQQKLKRGEKISYDHTLF